MGHNVIFTVVCVSQWEDEQVCDLFGSKDRSGLSLMLTESCGTTFHELFEKVMNCFLV